MPSDIYDLIVIGGGSGGSAVARRAAGYGAKVCIIDKGATRDATGQRTGAGFGGTCVNVGCVPKKLMYLASSEREHLLAGHLSGYGVSANASGAVDWAALKERRDAYVAMLNKNYENNWTKAGIEIAVGEATFEGPQSVRVTPHVSQGAARGAVRMLSAKKVVIAVGGMPTPLDVPGGELAISSDGFFDLPSRPKKVAVIGAGYIAVELAGILHGLGSETHLFFRGPTVLQHGFVRASPHRPTLSRACVATSLDSALSGSRAQDPYIIETLMEELGKHGPNLHAGSTPAGLLRASDGTITLQVRTQSGIVEDHVGFDCVLCAIGRVASTAALGLEKAGVATDERGRIVVDAFENTSTRNVLAIGDATTAGFDLTPVAIAAGRRLADRLFGGAPDARIEYACVATVVFSHPPIGCVGLTETQAREQFGDAAITVKKARFTSMKYALSPPDAKVRTAMKLVLKGAEERVVGLHTIGPHSDEMLQGFAVAIRMGATRADFEAATAIHPTIAEELVTFGGWGQQPTGPEGALRPVLPPHLRRPAYAGRTAQAIGAALVVAAAAIVVVRARR